MERLLIKNGRVIDPVNNIDDKLDILIENGIIIDVQANINTNYDKLIDAENLIISPGFIDMHVHLRDPGQTHKETLETGAGAAVKGGFTTIVCMPNTSPINDNIETTEYIISKAKDLDILNILPVASVTKSLAGDILTDISALSKSGAIGFSDDGSAVVKSTILMEALKQIKNINSILIEHPEDHSITGSGIVNKGKVSELLQVEGIEDIAEDLIIARDIIIQEKTGGRLHLTHLSTKGSYQIIKDAKKRGIKISSDVTPHHLLLNEDKLLTGDTIFKVKPPLRTETDRQAMLNGIIDGTIDCIATDHAPHTLEEKSANIKNAPFGMTGVETAFGVLHENFVKKNIITINKLIELMASNPAKILQLKDKGEIKQGYIADITIIDPGKAYEFSKNSFVSKSSNSPFIDWKGIGVPVYTIVNGTIKYNHSSQ